MDGVFFSNCCSCRFIVLLEKISYTYPPLSKFIGHIITCNPGPSQEFFRSLNDCGLILVHSVQNQKDWRVNLIKYKRKRKVMELESGLCVTKFRKFVQ